MTFWQAVQWLVVGYLVLVVALALPLLWLRWREHRRQRKYVREGITEVERYLAQDRARR